LIKLWKLGALGGAYKTLGKASDWMKIWLGRAKGMQRNEASMSVESLGKAEGIQLS